MIGVHAKRTTWLSISMAAALFAIEELPTQLPHIHAGRLADPGHPKSDQAPTSPQKFDLETAATQLIEAHNRVRKEEKLSILSPSKKLQAAAEIQAEDMAKHSKMSHEGSDGSTVSDRVKAQGYEYRRVAENVAFGRFSIDEVMEGWMGSEEHRKNMLGAHSQIGAAVVLDKDGIPYWCVTFGLPKRK